MLLKRHTNKLMPCLNNGRRGRMSDNNDWDRMDRAIEAIEKVAKALRDIAQAINNHE